ncbi:putative baseplate assembly protein [Saccharopolyspora kobensis]|uniref:Baseplate assembly protein n=3 Tax=Saccharopolyspora kobensis TaxID=146035 RepID=A0A1H6APW3_9PSEU|nr:putative baseplate assembly protein [Saccharopolyspora kobensis]SEG50214.1 putative baseplate assembly protein [Saccharopolyspora kobensis]SFE75693.1 putative baseplate assembly protein [Saccharopolyspora kobensis]
MSTDAELRCGAEGRREKVREHRFGGVDAVEAADDGRTLVVTFIGRAPHGVGPENVRIDGGRRITGIGVLRVEVQREEDPELDDLMRVTLDRTGDTARYRLSIVAADPHGRPGTEPYPGFDQRYFSAEFTFRPGGPTPFDCAEEPGCPPEARPAPLIDYTARDYSTLRQVLLDRLALTTPAWTERLAPDLGMTLVELFAHAGDQLSYQQDAVATEAYLDTARRRVSVRRHVRLIDYAMHDGCNARAFVVIGTAEDLLLEPGTFRFAAIDARPRGPHDPPEPGPVIDERELGLLDEQDTVEIFEPLSGDPLRLRRAHNEIRFWTWGDELCRLPRGATAATLRDEWAGAGRALDLRPGDLLVLEEVRGARSGTPGDADPAHRQAVRLTSVTPGVDELLDQPVLEVTWASEDALTFSLCLSTAGGFDCSPVPDVSVARGNVVLVDHGRTQRDPEIATAPPEPAVLPSCAPGFGCHDRTDGNEPAELIGALIDKTRRRSLAVKDVRELHAVLGIAATERAGIGLENAGRRRQQVVPATTHAQVDALRRLLAQSVYPGIEPRFRPVLQRSPVAQAVPFPVAGHIAAGQAARLAAIPGRVQQRLVELWRSAREDGLDEDEIDELTTLFGSRFAERLRVRPVPVLRELLHLSDELLAAKRRRLDVLIARARAGTVLGPDIAWEIACGWGLPYAEGLEPAEPVLHGPATAVVQDPRDAMPAVRVFDGDEVWTPRRDLLRSGPRDRHFVGELDDDGRLVLRFGDGRYGAAPKPGARLEIGYRIGGGEAGNVGAEAINRLVIRSGPLPAVQVRNPLPAVGGTEPEPVEQVRQLAPLDLRRTRLRAVTAEDYAAVAGELRGVQRAAAELRWTGSRQQVHVAIDAAGSGEPSRELLAEVGDHLRRYRRIGHELIVRPAQRVPLDLALRVCAEHGHQRGQIIAELRRIFGRRGFFHPDALSFGEPVRVSRLVAAATAVPGVTDARVTRLQRLFHGDAGELAEGLLRVHGLEIACCDNDPEHPENGILALDFGGER